MNVFKDLWKDKPLLITAIVAVIGIIYILYRQNSSNVVASSAPGSATAADTTSGGTPGTYVEYSYYNNTPTSTTNNYTGIPSTPVAIPPIVVAPGGSKPPVTKPPVVTPTKPPNTGLLGPGVRIFPQSDGTLKYRGPKTGGKIIPVPLPKGTIFGPGAQGRYWYRLPGSKTTQLLTSG